MNKTVTLELAAQCYGITVNELRAALAMEDFIPHGNEIGMDTVARVFRLYIDNPERRERQRASDENRMRRMRAER